MKCFKSMKDKISITYVLRLIVILLMVAWCFFIVRPFLLIILWAIILAVTLYPLYNKWILKFGKQKKTGVILFTLIVALILFTPLYFMVGSVVENTKLTITQIQDHSLKIPQPNESVKTWPLIGEKLFVEWDGLSKNLREYTVVHKDFILERGRGLLTNITGFIGSLVSFIIAFLIAIVFMYHSDAGYRTSQQLMQKLVGQQSEDILHMSRDTIRSVMTFNVLLDKFFKCFIGYSPMTVRLK